MFSLIFSNIFCLIVPYRNVVGLALRFLSKWDSPHRCSSAHRTVSKMNLLILFRFFAIGHTYQMPQSKSCVINDARMQEIFTDTKVLSHCNPKELFKLKTRPGGGALYTSDWANIKKFSQTLSLILDEPNGTSLTHRPLVKQLDTFLRAQKPPKIWSSADIDESCDFLRCSNSVGILYEAWGSRFGCGGFGFCLLFFEWCVELYPKLRFKEDDLLFHLYYIF